MKQDKLFSLGDLQSLQLHARERATDFDLNNKEDAAGLLRKIAESIEKLVQDTPSTKSVSLDSTLSLMDKKVLSAAVVDSYPALGLRLKTTKY